MAWVAVDKEKSEFIYKTKPFKNEDCELWWSDMCFIKLPKGSIKKLIGRDLTWNDEPVELKD